MNNIIQHFEEKITCELEKELENIFIEGNKDISDVITLVNKNLNELGCNIIKYLLEKSNEVIKDSPERLKSWVVKQNDMDKTLITKFGSVEFQRTYFDSKEDLIEEIAENYSQIAIKLIEQVADRKDIKAVEKINEAINVVSQYKMTREKVRQNIKSAFNNESNLKLQKRLFTKIKRKSIGPLQDILEQGINEGVIECSNSRELSEFLFYCLRALNDSFEELFVRGNGNNITEEDLEEKAIFYEKTFSRVLNLKNGSINLRNSFIKRFK